MLSSVTSTFKNFGARVGLMDAPQIPLRSKFIPQHGSYAESGGRGTLIINAASTSVANEIHGFLGQDGKFVSHANDKDSGCIVYFNETGTSIERIYRGEIDHLYSSPAKKGIIQYKNFIFTGNVDVHGMAASFGRVVLANAWECECQPNFDGTLPDKFLKFTLPNGWTCECVPNLDGTIPQKNLEFTLPNGQKYKCQPNLDGTIPKITPESDTLKLKERNCNIQGSTNKDIIPQRLEPVEITLSHGWKYKSVPNAAGTTPNTPTFIAPNGKKHVNTLQNFDIFTTGLLDQEVASLTARGIQQRLI